MIRVTIIAPAMAVRAGLRALLSDDPQIQVVAEAASMAEVEKSPLDSEVVIWSPTPAAEPESVRIELRDSQFGETSALLLIHNDPKFVERLLKLPLRSWGVLDPEATQAELLAAVHALNEGLVAVNPVWLKQALANPATTFDENQALIEPLTDREIEILQLLAYGLTNKQIAVRLKISAHTVKFHVSTIFTKLGTTNRVETVNLGLKKGLILL